MKTTHYVKDPSRPSGWKPVEIEASTPTQPATLEFERDPSRPGGYRPKASPTSKVKAAVVAGLGWLASAVNRPRPQSNAALARCAGRMGHARASGDAQRLHRAFAVALVENGTFPAETLNHQD